VPTYTPFECVRTVIVQQHCPPVGPTMVDAQSKGAISMGYVLQAKGREQNRQVVVSDSQST
jgi:hypothetical protein